MVVLEANHDKGLIVPFFNRARVGQGPVFTNFHLEQAVLIRGILVKQVHQLIETVDGGT